jgi:hypothetical protein
MARVPKVLGKKQIEVTSSLVLSHVVSLPEDDDNHQSTVILPEII